MKYDKRQTSLIFLFCYIFLLSWQQKVRVVCNVRKPCTTNNYNTQAAVNWWQLPVVADQSVSSKHSFLKISIHIFERVHRVFMYDYGQTSTNSSQSGCLDILNYQRLEVITTNFLQPISCKYLRPPYKYVSELRRCVQQYNSRTHIYPIADLHIPNHVHHFANATTCYHQLS